jgi:hypothetical protein
VVNTRPIAVRDKPAESFKRSRRRKETRVGRIEVSKIGIDLKDPIRLDQYYRADVNGVVSLRKEWFVLYPRNNIVQIPRDYKKYNC